MGASVGWLRRPVARTPPWRSALGWVVVTNGVLVMLVGGDLGTGTLVVALAVPLVAALVSRPQNGLLVMAAIAPLDGLLILSPGLAVLANWKFVVVLGTIGATFLAPDARAPAGRRRPSWFPIAVSLVALCVVSALFVGGLQAINGLRLNFFYCLVAWAAWRCPLNRRELDRLVTIFMVTGFLAAVWGLVQQLLGAEYLNAIGYEYNTSIRTSAGFLRSFGTFPSPFGLGFFEMLVIVVGLPCALVDPRRLRNRLFLIAMPIYMAGLAVTVVRGAYIGVALGIAYLGWHRYRALLLLIPLGAVTVLLLPAEFGGAALSGSSSVERVDSWDRALPQVLDHPLGSGVGATGSAAAKTAVQEQLGSALASTQNTDIASDHFEPDSYYVKTVIELGPVGLWLFCLLLWGMFVALRTASHRLTGVDAAFVAGGSALVLAAAAASLVATYFEQYPMDMLFWLVVGQATAIASTSMPRPDVEESGALQPCADHASPVVGLSAAAPPVHRGAERPPPSRPDRPPGRDR